MQPWLWSGVGACIALATASGLADRRRGRRDDPDRVGPVAWTTVQFVALFAAIVLAALAVSG